LRICCEFTQKAAVAHGFAHAGHVAEPGADELLDEFIMVAADVDDLGLLAAFAEQFLDERVVVVAPKPAELQLPAVNEIADEIKIFAVHHAEEIQTERNCFFSGLKKSGWATIKMF
jgi:hypothetical protein